MSLHLYVPAMQENGSKASTVTFSSREASGAQFQLSHRATHSPVTAAAPAALSAAAADCNEVPVVQVSSTTSTRFPSIRGRAASGTAKRAALATRETFTWPHSMSTRLIWYFPPLAGSVSQRLPMTLSSRVREDVVKPLFLDPNPPLLRVEVSVIIDNVTAQDMALRDYLKQILGSEFDEVRETSDLEKRGAVSVRCVRDSHYRNVPDEYHAYVVFDRTVVDLSSRPFGDVAISSRRDESAFRYIVAVRASEEARDKAEALLQRVLARLELL